jgi:hypothetical protein
MMLREAGCGWVGPVISSRRRNGSPQSGPSASQLLMKCGQSGLSADAEDVVGVPDLPSSPYSLLHTRLKYQLAPSQTVSRRLVN